jgi:hypothetical protein
MTKDEEKAPASKRVLDRKKRQAALLKANLKRRKSGTVASKSPAHSPKD